MNERETSGYICADPVPTVESVRRELLAWANRRRDDFGLQRNALDIRDALLTADTPEARVRLMEFVTGFGKRVSAKNS